MKFDVSCCLNFQEHLFSVQNHECMYFEWFRHLNTVNNRYLDRSGDPMVDLRLNRKLITGRTFDNPKTLLKPPSDIWTARLDHFVTNKICFVNILFKKRSRLVNIWYPEDYSITGNRYTAEYSQHPKFGLSRFLMVTFRTLF